jgi:hypothetical protein
MITKFDKYNESIEEEYPFKEIIDLYKLGNTCCAGDDLPDCQEFERKLKRKVLNKYCEFQEDVESVDKDGHIERVGGKIVKGKIIDVNIETFFDFDITIEFTVEDIPAIYPWKFHCDEVHPFYPVTVYLKEERKKHVNLELDPYGEEEWDD